MLKLLFGVVSISQIGCSDDLPPKVVHIESQSKVILANPLRRGLLGISMTFSPQWQAGRKRKLSLNLADGFTPDMLHVLGRSKIHSFKKTNNIANG